MLIPWEDNRTGISWNYFDSEYARKIAAYETYGRPGVSKEFHDHPVRPYTELYPPDKYYFTPEAAWRAVVLDRISRVANRRLTDPNSFSNEFFKRLVNKAYVTIFELGPCFQV